MGTMQTLVCDLECFMTNPLLQADEDQHQSPA